MRLTWIVVDVDIHETVVNNLTDCAVVRDEIGKAQAPRTPVTTNLTDDELSFRLSFGNGLVYLFDGVDIFVVYFL